jgi:hypothetical protein
MCKVRVKDKIDIESMLSKQNMLSIKQLYAQKKLTEVWKAASFKKYPLVITRISSCHPDGMITRGATVTS